MTKHYTCPMHPEVTSDKEGSCPKCGMNLVTQEEVQKEENQSNQGQEAKKMSCSCC